MLVHCIRLLDRSVNFIMKLMSFASKIFKCNAPCFARGEAYSKMLVYTVAGLINCVPVHGRCIWLGELFVHGELHAEVRGRAMYTIRIAAEKTHYQRPQPSMLNN
jgi:hypothetical protein